MKQITSFFKSYKKEKNKLHPLLFVINELNCTPDYLLLKYNEKEEKSIPIEKHIEFFVECKKDFSLFYSKNNIEFLLFKNDKRINFKEREFTNEEISCTVYKKNSKEKSDYTKTFNLTDNVYEFEDYNTKNLSKRELDFNILKKSFSNKKEFLRKLIEFNMYDMLGLLIEKGMISEAEIFDL